MDRMIIVEVLGRSGRVAHRVRIDGSAFVGRAYDNDVIVDDPFVDPHALEITATEEGTIVVRDLGTTNGVSTSDGRVEEQAPVRPGDVLRVGRTRLRVLRPQTPVSPTLEERKGRLSALAASRAGLPIALLAFLALWSITSYNTEVDDFTAAVLLTELVGLLMLLALWAGAWAIGARLASGRARFREHATIAVALVTAWMPLGFLLGVLAFLWPGDLTDLLSLASGMALATLIIYGHLGVSSHMRRRTRGLVAGSTVLALTGLGYLVGTIDPGPELSVQGELGSLLPVPADFIPAAGLDDFLDEATAELESALGDDASS